MKLLLATNNPGKLAEMRRGLVDLNWQLLSLKDLSIQEQPEETGQTFKANAQIKAEFYARISQMPTLADDGGFVIPALNGEPGVKSRRWPGYEAPDEELIQLTLNKIKNIPVAKRTGYLELVLCYFDPVKKIYLYENERITGQIADKPTKKRIPGFPYRALLIVDKFHKYYDELTSEEHRQANHRLRALKKLQAKLQKLYV